MCDVIGGKRRRAARRQAGSARLFDPGHSAHPDRADSSDRQALGGALEGRDAVLQRRVGVEQMVQATVVS